MSNESRVLDVFGPNLVIESNGPVGVAGPLAYQLYSVTDKGAKWQQALHGSGLSSMEASHTLEIQTGSKNKQGQISYMAMAHNGDMCMTTENGWIRIHGQNIVLDASNEILLQGAKVTLGNAKGTTEQTEILGEKIRFLNKLESYGKLGMRFCKEIIKNVSGKYKSPLTLAKIGKDIDELDGKIELIGMTHLELKPITDMFSKRKENHIGNDIVLLGRESLNGYQLLKSETKRMIEILLEHEQEISKYLIYNTHNSMSVAVPGR